ncbi:MAG: hypothetical protein ACRCZS_28000, partial [Chroococcidiopsis sp.]
MPPFHSLGKDNGHFYAVAYVPGFYVHSSSKSRDEVFFVLSFSPSENYTRFSVSTVSPMGETFHYSRGTDKLDSAEYAMLRAWREERVPLHAWRFFPSASIESVAFTDDTARVAFEVARHRVAYIIFEARAHVWAQSQFPTEPLFHFDNADIPEPMTSTPEYEDIIQYITHDNN